jgi:hypothetical protein
LFIHPSGKSAWRERTQKKNNILARKPEEMVFENHVFRFMSQDIFLFLVLSRQALFQQGHHNLDYGQYSKQKTGT